MTGVLEFLGSLGIVGWIAVILCVLLLLNLGKVFRLRSPLDSQQHRSWRFSQETMRGGNTKPDHLEKKDIDI